MNTNLQKILAQYSVQNIQIDVISGGLINQTWKISTADAAYILQRVNHHVFKKPTDIDFNLKNLSNYLNQTHSDYLFVAPIENTEGVSLVHFEDNFYRLLPFVADSHTIDVVATPEQAYEAAAQFGQFTARLSGFDAAVLRDSIPDFHNLSLRYAQFITAIKTGNPQRKKETADLTKDLLAQKHLVKTYESILLNPDFKRRVTHHDTKISNVLFDNQDKGLCVIDLDTVMSGYFISDVGDMMRTYLSPVSEEDNDFSKIEVRKSIFEAIVAGYSEAMSDALTATEKQFFSYAGQFLVYMQALRFLTDYLNDDVYYGAKYPTHNFVRAKNQAVLLSKLTKMVTT